MKNQKYTLTVCMLLIAGMLFAGVSQSIGLGAGLNSYSNDFKEGGLGKMSTNAFGISITGMTTFDKVEHLVIYENIDLGFPKKFKSDGITEEVDKGTLLGLTVGAGYTSKIDKSPFSYSVGGGLGWFDFVVEESGVRMSFSNFSVSLFGNVRYEIKNGWFADLTMLDTMGFRTTVKFDPVSSAYSAFSNNLAVKIGGGYRFDF